MSSTEIPAVWIIQHVPQEGPGLFGQWLAEEGLPVRIMHMHDDVVLPTDLQQCRGLIVLGGPMSVADVAVCPWLVREQALISQVIAADIPVIGMCLGAQLIAHTLGARVYQATAPEVGWLPIQGTVAARTDPLCAMLPAAYTVFQLHSETFDLPTDAVMLASSSTCPHQAFRYQQHVYALQFHLEVTAEMVELWMGNTADTLVQTVGATRAAAVIQQSNIYAAAAEILARQFYSCWRTLLR